MALVFDLKQVFLSDSVFSQKLKLKRVVVQYILVSTALTTNPSS